MRIRNGLTFGNVMSVIALFIALGGTGYAAVALPKNSVGAKQIKKNAVAASEIRKNAVRSGEVKNGALRRADFAASQLPVGPQGPQGPQGIQGPQGTFGQVTVQFESAPVDLADGTAQEYGVDCPQGQVGIGGGVRGDASDSEDTEIGSSRPVIDATSGNAPTDGGTFLGWRAHVENPTAGGATTGIRPEVWVVCATP